MKNFNICDSLELYMNENWSDTIVIGPVKHPNYNSVIQPLVKANKLKDDSWMRMYLVREEKIFVEYDMSEKIFYVSVESIFGKIYNYFVPDVLIINSCLTKWLESRFNLSNVNGCIPLWECEWKDVILQ